MVENTHDDIDKPIFTVKDTIAKNSLVSLQMNEKCPFIISVAFKTFTKRWGHIGLNRFSLQGALDGCKAHFLGKKCNILGSNIEYVQIEEVIESGRIKSTEQELQITTKPAAKGKRTSELKETHTSKESKRTTTFYEYSNGEKPEWIFKASPENSPPLLEGPYGIPIQFDFTSSPSFASGVFSGESLRNIRIVNSKGKDVSWLRYWLVIAKLKKDIYPEPVKLSFMPYNQQMGLK